MRRLQSCRYRGDDIKRGVWLDGLGCALAMAIWIGRRDRGHRGRAASGRRHARPAIADEPRQSSTRFTARGRPWRFPEGRIRGTAILSPGTRRTRALSRGARLMWQGKVIEPGQTSAVNRFFGMPRGPRPDLLGPELARRPALVGPRLQPDLVRLRQQSRRDPPGRPGALSGPHVRPDDRPARASRCISRSKSQP